MLPSKRARLDLAQEQARSVFEEQAAELEATKQALRAAMSLLGDPFHIMHYWKNMPDEIRNNVTAIVQVMTLDPQKDRHFDIRRKDLSPAVLAQVREILLQTDRAAALRAYQDDFFTWEEVNPTVEECQNSVHMSLEYLRRNARDFNIGIDIFQSLPALTREILCHKLQEGKLHWDRHIAQDLKADQAFCRMVLLVDPDRKDEHGSSVYRFHSSSSFPGIVLEIFRQHANIALDRGIWESIIGLVKSKHFCASIFNDLFANGFDPPGDDLLQRALEAAPSALNDTNQVARENFVRELVRDNPAKFLFYLESPFIETNQDFVTSTFVLVDKNAAESCYLVEFAKRLPLAFWNNEDFSNAWLEKGFPLVPNVHPPEWFQDHSKVLKVIENAPNQASRDTTFRSLPDNFKDDLGFIEGAMKYDPALFQYASKRIREDEANYKLVTWAFTTRRFIESVTESLQRSRVRCILTLAQLEEFDRKAGADVALYRNFKYLFMCAVLRSAKTNAQGSNDNSNNNHLGKLDRGLLELIGAFAGFPRGDYKRNLFKSRRLLVSIGEERQREEEERREVQAILAGTR